MDRISIFRSCLVWRCVVSEGGGVGLRAKSCKQNSSGTVWPWKIEAVMSFETSGITAVTDSNRTVCCVLCYTRASTTLHRLCEQQWDKAQFWPNCESHVLHLQHTVTLDWPHCKFCGLCVCSKHQKTEPREQIEMQINKHGYRQRKGNCSCPCHKVIQ
jgi:hypothetical protein